MRIKKHPSGNEYVTAGGVWVRNPTKTGVAPLQLTPLFGRADHAAVLRNEEANKNFARIADEPVRFKKAIVVSDGHDFDRRHRLLAGLPRDTAVLAVNRALAKWTLVSPQEPPERRRTVNALVVNDPGKDCGRCLAPDAKYFPTCLASARADHAFCKAYRGTLYAYTPTPEAKFGRASADVYTIDDYRNPVCAAVGLAHRFGVTKLLLLCCDDSFPEARFGSVPLANGLHAYPQQVRSHAILDAVLFWLTREDGGTLAAADYSSGPVYQNARYIKSDEEALDFLND